MRPQFRGRLPGQGARGRKRDEVAVIDRLAPRVEEHAEDQPARFLALGATSGPKEPSGYPDRVGPAEADARAAPPVRRITGDEARLEVAGKPATWHKYECTVTAAVGYRCGARSQCAARLSRPSSESLATAVASARAELRGMERGLLAMAVRPSGGQSSGNRQSGL